MVRDKDKGWKKIKRELRGAHNSGVLIGFMSGKSAPLDVKKAIWNEFGTEVNSKERIPSRPFMRYTFKKYLKKVYNFQQNKYGQVLKGTMTMKRGLSHLGEFYTTLVKLSIRTGPWKSNASSTLKGKKSSKPLIDTNEMLKAVKYNVLRKGL